MGTAWRIWRHSMRWRVGRPPSARRSASRPIPASTASRPNGWSRPAPGPSPPYVEDPLETRFIQSFKTFAASAAFTETRIDNRRYAFEDLLAAFLLRLRHHAGEALDAMPPAVIVGRPVTFAGGNPDEALALGRYQTAFQRLGFTDIRYAHEPVGAAFLFRAPADAGRHGPGRRLRRRHQRLLDHPVRADGRWLAFDADGPVGRGRGRRRLRLSDHRSVGVARTGQGRPLQLGRQATSDPATLLFRLRPLGPVGPATRIAGHARHPRAGPHGAGAREDRTPDRGAGRPTTATTCIAPFRP